MRRKSRLYAIFYSRCQVARFCLMCHWHFLFIQSISVMGFRDGDRHNVHRWSLLYFSTVRRLIWYAFMPDMPDMICNGTLTAMLISRLKSPMLPPNEKIYRILLKNWQLAYHNILSSGSWVRLSVCCIWLFRLQFIFTHAYCTTWSR